MLEAAPEQVYYGDGLVWVTHSRVVFGHSSYTLASFGKATIRALSPRDRLRLTPVFFVLMLAWMPLLYLWSAQDEFLRGLDNVLTILIVVLVLVTVYFVITQSRKIKRATVYFIQLGRVGSAFASIDEIYINYLAEQINLAKGIAPQRTTTQLPPVQKRGLDAAQYLYLDTAQVQITSASVTVAAGSYRTADIRRVYVAPGTIDAKGSLFLAGSLVLQLFSRYLDYFARHALSDGGTLASVISTILNTVGCTFPFVSLILALISFQYIRSGAYSIWLKLTTGNTEILATMDRAYAEYIAGAIREAIKGRDTTSSPTLNSPEATI